MLLLLEKRAAANDVLWYIESIRIPALLDEFCSLFIPRLEEAGLLGPEVQAAYTLCRNRVEHESDVRLYEAPTRKIRTGI
jgi:hypothetical protein